MRLQFVAIRANGASAAVSKMPDALRVDLILGNAKEDGPAPGGYSRRPASALFQGDPVTRTRRPVARGSL